MALLMRCEACGHECSEQFVPTRPFRMASGEYPIRYCPQCGAPKMEYVEEDPPGVWEATRLQIAQQASEKAVYDAAYQKARESDGE